MKIINSKLHGIIDYIVVLFLMLAPTLFGLSALIAFLTYALGLIHLTLTIFTNFSYGVVKVIPLKIHGLIELIVAIALMASPLMLDGLTEHSIDRFFFAGFGVAVLLTWALTDYSN